MRVLVTGATGFVGSALVSALANHELRAVSRSDVQIPGVEVIQGDLQDRETLDRALAGIEAAYYLVHGLDGGPRYGEEERLAAIAFAEAAAAAGVEQIVYLGALARGDALSEHLASRQEVGEILRAGAVRTIEFRASVIIGAGSASFELIRMLVEKAPMLALPDWIETEAQPIALDDVVAYLVEALALPSGGSGVYEIGGPDRVSYRQLLQETAAALGKERVIVAFPLPAGAADLLAPFAPKELAVWAKLVESLRFDSTIVDGAARADLAVRPTGLRAAIESALAGAA